MRGQKETRACAACGKSLTRLVSQAKGRRWYCDKRCQASHMLPPLAVGKTPNPYRGQKETRPCVECGTPVTRYLSPARLAGPWFCSKSCNGKERIRVYRATGVMRGGLKPRRGDTVPCAVCGKAFYRRPGYIRQGRKYCSVACNAIGQRRPALRTCAVCGKEEMVPASKAHLKHCSKYCEAIGKTKHPTGRMHNGRPVTAHKGGYFLIYEPTHPGAHKRNGRVLEHRWLMEQALGRYLTKDERVDHINGNTQDNRLENLQILSATAHTIKTNGDRKKRERSLEEKLAEYERRYGPLED